MIAFERLDFSLLTIFYNYDNSSVIEKIDAFSYLIIIFLFVICVILNIVLYDADVDNYINNHSKLLSYIKSTNKKFSFTDIPKSSVLYYNKRTKSEFDRFEYDFEIVNTFNENRDIKKNNKKKHIIRI